MAFVSRSLTKTEERVGRLTQLVSVVGWALHRLRRYTTFATLIRVVLPDAADVLTVLDVRSNMRLRACVVNV